MLNLNHELNMQVAILIKILLEITLLGFMLTIRDSNDCVFLDESGNNAQCFKLIFSQHQYLIDHLVKIYKATSNLTELVSKI